MLSQERVTELVEELQSAARAWVSNYAAVHAPHVPGLKVKAILSALGGMSVEEAMRALDEGEASYVQHQQQDGPQARGAAVHDETSH